jgi:hypothetical protein
MPGPQTFQDLLKKAWLAECTVLARIKFKHPKKHVAITMTRRLGEIFLVKCQKQEFSFNKREAKVYCYTFLHLLKRDTFIKHEEIKKKKVSCVLAAALACRPGTQKFPG